MKNYVKIASYYDRFINKNFYKILINYLRGKIIPDNEKVLLDLGTGTGFFPLYYAEKGMYSVGIDQSKEMLSYAKKYAKEKKIKNVQFIQKDFFKLDFSQEFDYVTMFFDVLNHILNIKKIDLLFKKVNNALKENGEFYFDILSLWGMKKMWGTDQFIEYYDDFSILWHSEWNGKSQKLKVTLKIKSEGEILKETFIERGFSTKTITERLEKNGFVVKNITPLFFYKKKPSRYLFFAKKVKNLL